MPERNLTEKLTEWLASEGYPLEFRTACEFLRCGFTVRQGSYVKTFDETPREVDVLAYRTAPDDRIRIYQVTECKWSGDKPWVVFTSTTHHMATSACVNQTISSLLGRAIVWILAGDAEVRRLGLFASPERGGFGGRQAFSKGNDLFYNAIQSVISKANSLVSEYDKGCDANSMIPEWGAIAFPVVVVEGGLFEAFMEQTSGEIVVKSADHVRVHWRGSDDWDLHATVDIITDSYIHEFAAKRARETDALLEKARLARTNIELCWHQNSLRDLLFHPAPRGTMGLPPVLRTIARREREQQAQRQLASSEAEQTNVADDSPDPRTAE